MSANTERTVEAISAPTKLDYPFFRQSGGDWVAIAVFSLCTLTGMIRYDMFGLLALGVPSLFLMWPTIYGKRYYVIWQNTVVRWWYLVVLEGYLWENEKHPNYVEREVVWWKRALKWAIRIAHPFPFSVDWIDQVATNGEPYQIGLIYNSRRNTYSAVVEAVGSKIPTMSIENQSASLERIADEIQQLAYYRGLSAKVGFNFMRRPANMVEFGEVVDTSLVPEIVVPHAAAKLQGFIATLDQKLTFEERLLKVREECDRLYENGELTRDETADYRLHLSMLEDEHAVQTIGSDTWMTATITIRRNNQLADASLGKKPLTESQAARQDIVRLIKSFCEQLQVAGVHEPHVLNREETEDYIASAIHAVELDDYRLRAAEITEDSELDVYHPQIAMEVTDDLAIIDNTGHALMKIVNLPASVLPTTMIELINGVRTVRWMSRSLTSESSTGKSEYTFAVWIRNLYDDLLGSFGVKYGHKTEKRQIGADERQRQLADQNHVEYITIYMAMAGETREEILDGMMEIERVVRTIGGRAKAIRITGAARMMNETLSAVTSIVV